MKQTQTSRVKFNNILEHHIQERNHLEEHHIRHIVVEHMDQRIQHHTLQGVRTNKKVNYKPPYPPASPIMRCPPSPSIPPPIATAAAAASAE
jgi:hypothetical protein